MDASMVERMVGRKVGRKVVVMAESMVVMKAVLGLRMAAPKVGRKVGM